MQTHELIAHPAFPPLAVSSVEARVLQRDSQWLRVRWRIENAGRLVLPPFVGRKRSDELWKTTCFEIFLKEPGAQSYTEWNLSPSEGWNAYNFDDYREGMRERHVPRTPDCTMRPGNAFAVFDAAIPASTISDDEQQMGITCVLEEEGGVKSFWAMKHAKDQPDFHDPACFAARLAAPTAP